MFSLIPMCSRLFPSVPSVRLRVSDFMFRSLIHLNFRLCRVIYSVSFSLTSIICYRFFHFSIVYFVLFIKNQCLCVCGFTFMSSILFNWTSCLFLCQYYTVLLWLLCSTNCNKDADTLVSLIVQDCFNYTIFSLYELSIILSKSVKNFVGILMGIALTLYVAFGKMAIFTMLILPVHEHRKSFHLLISLSHK